MANRLPGWGALIALCAMIAFAWPDRAEAAFLDGIDVSHWQGSINWNSVKNAGIDFAFTKATEGIDFVDPRYHANMQGARAAGVPIGPYHFCRLDSYSTDPLDAINEANDFLEAILPYYRTGMHLPPVADVERFPPFGSTDEARTFTSSWVQKFSDTVYYALGVRPIVYQSLSKANTYYTRAVAGPHELWLAWWRGTGTTQPPQPSDTPLWGAWQFWQWSDGSDAIAQASPVPGISANVDRNVFDGSVEELQSLMLGNDGAIPGDYNRDNTVDAADYILWRKTMGQIVPIYSGADGNGNARIDAEDYAIWTKNAGRSAGAGSLAGSGAIPEPTAITIVLIAFGLALLSRIERRGAYKLCLALLCFAASAGAMMTSPAAAQQASMPVWDAAEFRVWGFVPYWSGQSGSSVVQQLNILSAEGTYDHVSDVIYFGGVRPTSTGGVAYHSTAVSTLNTLKNHSEQHGFQLHLSMFDVASGSVDATWESIIANPTYRANFVNNVTGVLQTYGMSGFNFDWERPNSTAEWGNYTQLARELGDIIRPLGMEVSVCDYGSTDSRWDDTALFDARVYDQLFIMIYHLGASSSNTYANQKLNLTGQGAEKAFTDEQLTLGVGTWGSGGPATVRLREFVAANPALPYDAGTVSGTFTSVSGNSVSGTWNIESRQQVREKTQLALNRNMPGMFSWTLHYDATNELGLHRVMHHYIAFQRGAPDLNLDGQIDQADADTLADNMGSVLIKNSTGTAAQFDKFYLDGNWEQGDRDGNGYVNQLDADWLAGRFASLGIVVPDRLAYSGTFETLQDSHGLTGRWRAKRDGANLRETGNYSQHGAGFLAWSGTGVGAEQHGNDFVNIRNRNAAEQADNINRAARQFQADLAEPIDLSADQTYYVTFLVQQNSAPLTASQSTSIHRTLSLEFLDEAGTNQFDFRFRGFQQQFEIQSQADAAGQDVSAGGFLPDTTFLFVGKVSGKGAAANTMQASIFASGADVGNYADPNFPWMLTAEGSEGFNPTITQLQFTSLLEANYTVSNVWTGAAADFFAMPSAAMGDFNADGAVDGSDYIVWRKTAGNTGILLAADADGNGMVDEADLHVWRANFGHALGGGSATRLAVPEPTNIVWIPAAIMGWIAAGCRPASGRR